MSCMSMMPACLAPDCNNCYENSNATFHRLPIDPKLRAEWLTRIRRANPPPSLDKARLCSAHFTDDDFERDLRCELTGSKPMRRLKPGVVPTVFNYNYEAARAANLLAIEEIYSSSASILNKSPVDTDSMTDLEGEEVEVQGMTDLQRWPPDTGVRVADLNDLLTCVICKGYLHNATTITECLHSFCKSCLVRHVTFSLNCPKCRLLIHPTDPFVNIRLDSTLQDIVYKLLPNIEKEENRREREFYRQRGLLHPATGPLRKYASPIRKRVSKIFHRSLNRQFRLMKHQPPRPAFISVELIYIGGEAEMHLVELRRCFVCLPCYARVRHLQKYLHKHLHLGTHMQAYIFVYDYLLDESLTLNNVCDLFYYDRDVNKSIPLHYGLLPTDAYMTMELSTSEESETSVVSEDMET